MTPYLQNGRPGGLEIFLCSWGPLILQNKILASGPGVWMVRFYVSAVHLRPLQSVLNSAARIILRKQRHDHITADIRDLLHWLPVQRRIEYKMCVLVFKCLHQLAPIIRVMYPRRRNCHMESPAFSSARQSRHLVL